MKRATWFFVTPGFIVPFTVFWRSLLLHNDRDVFGDVIIHGLCKEQLPNTDRRFRFRPCDISRWHGWPASEPRFFPNYSKLEVLECDEYDQILVLDTDMICTGPLDEMVESDGDFVAVGEDGPNNSLATLFSDAPAWRFNGGTWRIRKPLCGNSGSIAEISEHMMAGKLYDQSEQSALVAWLQGRGLKPTLLPWKYNMELGLAQYPQHRHLWHAHVDDCRILHLTGPRKAWTTPPPHMGWRERFRELWERAYRGDKIYSADVARVCIDE